MGYGYLWWYGGVGESSYRWPDGRSRCAALPLVGFEFGLHLVCAPSWPQPQPQPHRTMGSTQQERQNENDRDLSSEHTSGLPPRGTVICLLFPPIHHATTPLTAPLAAHQEATNCPMPCPAYSPTNVLPPQVITHPP